MNRLSRLMLAGVLALAITGCAEVRVEAPAGNPTALASTGKTYTKVKSYSKWYFAWGLMPVSDISTAQDIQDSGFKSVKVVTKMGADDFIMSLLGAVPLIPVSRTVEVWGE